MELNQLQTILANLTIPEEYSQSIMAEAKAVTMNTTGFLGTILDAPIELADSQPFEDGGQATLALPFAEETPAQETPVFEQLVTMPKQIGEYDDLGELGEGGMGSVRLVRDRKLNRRLAMKIIHPKLLAHRSAAARFVEEAQVCAQLQHPNIVPVHDLGTLPDGRLYFTMKEIKGRSLETVIKSVHASVKDGRFHPTEDGWTFRRLIDVFHKVCQAVGYAHSKGVLHRDLKPENIMLGEFGEVLVVDWGIAKVLGRIDRVAEADELISSSRHHAQATRMGQAIGTPSYMSPEQANGELHRVDQRSDVYALGAILYQILCNFPPYTGASAEDILRQVRTRPPVSIDTRLDGDAGNTTFELNFDDLSSVLDVPQDLIDVCDIAMAREIEQRFDNVERLSTAVLDWLEGAKKREKAIAVVKETEALAVRRESLKVESKRLLAEAEEGLKDIPKWADESVKGPHWAKDREGLAKVRESQRLDLDIEYRLQSALSHKADLEEAHEALGQRYLKFHKEAELERDESKAEQSELRLRHHVLALPEGHAFR